MLAREAKVGGKINALDVKFRQVVDILVNKGSLNPEQHETFVAQVIREIPQFVATKAWEFASECFNLAETDPVLRDAAKKALQELENTAAAINEVEVKFSQVVEVNFRQVVDILVKRGSLDRAQSENHVDQKIQFAIPQFVASKAAAFASRYLRSDPALSNAVKIALDDWKLSQELETATTTESTVTSCSGFEVTPLSVPEYKETCTLKCYLSLSCCWKCCGLHFEDAYDEHLFLNKDYFRSWAHIGFSSAFAVLQLVACIFFAIEMQWGTSLDSGEVGDYTNNIPLMIGSGISGIFILAIQTVEVCMWKVWKVCQDDNHTEIKMHGNKCAQRWHITRMVIGCIAAVAFYLGGFVTCLLDVYLYPLELNADITIDNVVHNCSILSEIDLDKSTDSSWKEDDWICAFFSKEWQFIDFIFVSAGPQTVFLHALPARLTLPILTIEIAATFGIFFWPVLQTGTTFFPAYLGYYQLCFALGLALVTITSERASRRNFKGQSNYSQFQTAFLDRLHNSDQLRLAMEEHCPKGLDFIRYIGDGPGRVPLDAQNVHQRVHFISKTSGKDLVTFRRNMNGENLDSCFIPANEIEVSHSEGDLGSGGQASVSKGKWKRWGWGSIDVAIKKWGSGDRAKYRNEVKVLKKLRHR